MTNLILQNRVLLQRGQGGCATLTIIKNYYELQESYTSFSLTSLATRTVQIQLKHAIGIVVTNKVYDK